MFSGRLKTGPAAGLFISCVLGAGWALLSVADLLVPEMLPSTRPLAYTVRLPTISMRTDPSTGRVDLNMERKVFPRGTTLTPEQLDTIRSTPLFKAPPTARSLILSGLLNALLIFFFSSLLRATGGAAVFVRTQLVILGSITCLLLVGKLLLMFTAFSAMWIPLVSTTLIVGLCVGRTASGSVAILGAIGLSLLIPFDLPFFLVMLIQGLTASAVVLRSRRNARLLLSTLFSAAAGGTTWLGVQLFFERIVSLDALTRGPIEISALLGSDPAGSVGSALVGGLLAITTLPLARTLLGQVSKTRLTALADFEHPLLRRLATEAPGTWAHSTNMANMAEMAANQIGADGSLLRVGAYYHDVGKCLHGGYFIENQEGDNPHDNLEPERSSDAIRAHVADGVKLARAHDVPEAIVEFIYTHHGNERLEYFWHKAQSSGSLHRIKERDFRYGGVWPQTKEQGILALCDAVEAASHTLKEPDIDQIEQLVRRIVFIKLRNGVLDRCGLTVRELRLITESFIETLRCALHVRVKYPWQEAEEARGGAPGPELPSSEKETVVQLKHKRPPSKPGRST